MKLFVEQLSLLAVNKFMDKSMVLARILLTLWVFLMSGCGGLLWFDETTEESFTRGEEYQSAAVESVIETPDGIPTPLFEPLYPIPPLVDKALPLEKGKFVLAPPTPLQVVWEEERIKIASNQQKTWVSINVAPSIAWESLLGFWQEQEVPLVYENARRGVMETEWIEVDDSRASVFGLRGKEALKSKLKMRVQVERGDFPDMTNVYLRQYFHNESSKALPQSEDIDWASSQRFEYVKSPLAALVSYLENNQAPPSSISLVAQSTSVEQLSEIVQRSGLNVLLLRNDFNRSWVSVGDALRRGKFPLEDLDRSQSVFYLELRDSEKNKSELLEQMLQNDEISKRQLGDYKLRLKLVKEANNILVRVENSQGLPAVNEVSAVILKRLKEYIG